MKRNNSKQHTDAILACESYLTEQKEYNISHKILNSEIEVINRLFNRRLELFQFYEEIFSKLDTQAWKRILSIVLYTAAFWNPEAAEHTRESIKKLNLLNLKISKCAESLSELLNERYEISEMNGLHSYDKFHVVDIIETASISNGLYGAYLKTPLKQLSGQFDLRYWPSVSEFLNVIAIDAQDAEVQAINNITEANINSVRNSLTDYFNALFEAINGERKSVNQFIPNDFHLSNESLASLANCALDLPEDKIKDAQYVKRLKQRINQSIG
jgi:hypothetical protein